MLTNTFALRLGLEIYGMITFMDTDVFLPKIILALFNHNECICLQALWGEKESTPLQPQRKFS